MYSKLLFWQRHPAIKYAVITPLMIISIISATLVTCGSLLSPFKLSVAGQIHAHLSLTPSHPHPFFPPYNFFFIYLFFRPPPLLLITNIQDITGAGWTLNLLFSVSKHAVFHDSFPGEIWLWGCPPGEISLRAGNYFSSHCCCTDIKTYIRPHKYTS